MLVLGDMTPMGPGDHVIQVLSCLQMRKVGLFVKDLLCLGGDFFKFSLGLFQLLLSLFQLPFGVFFVPMKLFKVVVTLGQL